MYTSKFAKQQVIQDSCHDAVYAVHEKLLKEYEARGNDHVDAMAYSSGYIQSLLAMVISELPKSRREDVLNTLARRVA